jgi:hypothetical protein
MPLRKVMHLMSISVKQNYVRQKIVCALPPAEYALLPSPGLEI